MHGVLSVKHHSHYYFRLFLRKSSGHLLAIKIMHNLAIDDKIELHNEPEM